MTARRKTQITITAVAAIAAVVHIIWPSIAIDSTTLVLLVIAAIPWLIPLFKTLEFPGGWKIEFQDLEEARNRAEEAGLLTGSEESSEGNDYAFQIIAEEDPNLALAGLRIEIERRLIRLADAADIEIKRGGIGQLLRILNENGLVTSEQKIVLNDMTGLLNAGAHGAVVNHMAARWALDVGPKLLGTFDKQIRDQREE